MMVVQLGLAMMPRLHEFAEHIIIYAVEANAVKSPVKNQVAAV